MPHAKIVSFALRLVNSPHVLSTLIIYPFRRNTVFTNLISLTFAQDVKMSLIFGTSSKNKPTLILMNYTYTQHRKNKDGRTYWRCTSYTKDCCRGRLVTSSENKILGNSTVTHTHAALPVISMSHIHRHDSKKEPAVEIGERTISPTKLEEHYKDYWKRGKDDNALSQPSSHEDSDDATIDEHSQPGRSVSYTSPGKNEDFIAQYNDAVKSLAKFRNNAKSNVRRSNTDNEDDSVRYTIKTVSKCQSKLSRGGKHLRSKWICY